MRIFWNIIGVLLIVAGGVWFLQGIGVLPGSFMTGQPQWEIFGGMAILLGAAWPGHSAVDVIARNPNAFVNGNSTNSIAANALTTTEGARNAAFSANVNVQTGAQITKSFAPNPIQAGGATPSTMTITISNFNFSNLTPITFTDSWAATMTVNGVPTTTCGGALTQEDICSFLNRYQRDQGEQDGYRSHASREGLGLAENQVKDARKHDSGGEDNRCQAKRERQKASQYKRPPPTGLRNINWHWSSYLQSHHRLFGPGTSPDSSG